MPYFYVNHSGVIHSSFQREKTVLKYCFTKLYMFTFIFKKLK